MTANTRLSVDLDLLLACAEEASRESGKYALRNARRRSEIVQLFDNDVKLKLDRECQQIAEKIIRSHFPNHNILGEETVAEYRDIEGIRWIIDPIDGTVNYFHGLPLWCCSVGVELNGRILAGSVYAPVLDECYTAHANKPACCNGEPIKASNTDSLQKAIVCTDMDKNTRDLLESVNLLKKLSKSLQRVRIMGSAALDICHVACGKIDGYYESGIYLWDAAAGSIIVNQAGGTARILKRSEGHRISFLAANSLLFDKLEGMLKLESLEMNHVR